MTAEAGQTSTKISIVNNKLNNDSSSSSDSAEAILLLEDSSDEATCAAPAYISSVPVPPEWRDQLPACESVSNSRRSPSVVQPLRWPNPETIVSNPGSLHAPVYTRRFLRLALRVLHNKRSLRTDRPSCQALCTEPSYTKMPHSTLFPDSKLPQTIAPIRSTDPPSSSTPQADPRMSGARDTSLASSGNNKEVPNRDIANEMEIETPNSDGVANPSDAHGGDNSTARPPTPPDVHPVDVDSDGDSIPGLTDRANVMDDDDPIDPHSEATPVSISDSHTPSPTIPTTLDSPDPGQQKSAAAYDYASLGG